MPLLFQNNASTTLSGSINNTQTTITVASSSSFPVPSGGSYFYATMYEVSGSTEINIEIVKVTAVVGANWTVVRAQDGTTARSRNGVTTCYIENRYNAASAALSLQKDENLSDIANAATARTNLGLGSMATQAASSVNITGGTIAGVTLTGLDSGTTLQDNGDATKQMRFELSGITTATTRTLTVPNASGTIALTSDLTTGYQPLDSDLTAIAALSANGIIARTGTGTAAIRAITQPAAGITVTNGDGVSGNPTLALANDLAGVEGLSTTGFVRRTAADTWSASALVDGDLPSALTGKTYNALALTAAATGFTIAGGTTSKTLTVSNTLTLAGTDSSTLNIGSGGTLGSAAYTASTAYAPAAGSASITTVGTITSGTWNGTAIAIANGGTGATSKAAAYNALTPITTLGDIVFGDGANSAARLAGNTTASRRFLRQTGTGSASAAPAWDGLVDGDVPATLTGKTINGITLTANATGFSAAGGTTSKTLTVNNSITLAGTDGTTITLPATSGTLPLNNQTFFIGTTSVAINRASASLSLTGVSIDGSAGSASSATTATTATNLAGGNNTTLLGAIGYQSNVNTTTLLSPNVSTTKQFLSQTGTGTNGAAPVWSTLVKGDVGLGNVENTALSTWTGSANLTTVGTIGAGTWQGSAIGLSYGGTGSTSKTAAFDNLSPATTLGDLIYSDGTDNVRLAGNTTASRRFLRQTGTGTVSAAPAWDALVDGDVPAALTGKTVNGITLTANATGFQVAGGTTSKTLVVQNNLTFSGTDGSTLNIGGGGTLGTGAFATIASYALLASPTFTGTPAAPTAAANTNTTQIATTAFVLGQANSTAATIAMNGTQAAGSSNLYARADHVHPVDTSRSPLAGSTSITTLGTIITGVWNGTAIAIANGGTGATTKAAGYNALTPITTLGDIVYGDGANSATRLAGNTTTSRRFLRQTGTGTVSAAPAWDALVDGDVPATLTGKTYNGLTLTAAATGFTIAGGTTSSKTLTLSNTLTLSGTDGSTLNIGAGGTLGTGAFATIANYALLASPTFTGTPAAPTAAANTNTTQIATTAFVLGQGNSTAATIAMNGTQAAGSSNLYARADHVHPTDTSRAPLASPSFTGNVATTGTVTARGTIAMQSSSIAGNPTIFSVQDQSGATFIEWGRTDGTASASGIDFHTGATSTDYDSRITASGGTGSTGGGTLQFLAASVLAPTAAVDTNNTQIATTAYVIGQASSAAPAMDGTAAVGTSLRYARADHVHASDTSRAPLASPTFTGTPAAPTAAVDTNTTQLATTAYVVGQGYLKSSTASSTYLALSGGTLTGNLTLSGTGRRIIADFSNATLASRAAFQTSTANGTTAVQAIANGTGAASSYVAFAGSDPANAAYAWLSATTSGVDIYSDKTGTGTVQPIRFLTGGTVRASVGALGGLDLSTGLREARVAMGASDIDLRAGNYFTRTISGATTLTVSNVPAAGTAASFILDLTNGGSATITWWSGMKWAGGTAPALTASGRDVLGFFTHDGGTTWTGLLLGKDVK